MTKRKYPTAPSRINKVWETLNKIKNISHATNKYEDYVVVVRYLDRQCLQSVISNGYSKELYREAALQELVSRDLLKVRKLSIRSLRLEHKTK